MKMFIAGLEFAVKYKDSYKLLYDNRDNFFMLTSFYYLRTNKEMLELIKVWNKENLLIDSGAFTFQEVGTKGTNIDDYIEEYIKFINDYDIKYFFDMDIDKDMSEFPKVLKYRERIEKGTGKKCIPVFHEHRGADEFKKMCDNYDYIAYGGLARGRNAKDFVNKFIKYANSRGVKVHGLGMTRKGFQDIGFYSVDSTSWNGCRFGDIYYWDDKEKIPKVYRKPKNKRLKTSLIDGIVLQNLNTWYVFQKYLRKYGIWKV